MSEEAFGSSLRRRFDQVHSNLESHTEAATRGVLQKKVFLEILQNSQERETLAQVFSCEFCKISKNTFSYRTTPVAASGHKLMIFSKQVLTFS